MEEYRTGTGQLLNVHSRHECKTPFACVIHEPSDHHMVGWSTHWRDDRKLMERICSHGIGHPDPDHLAFSNSSTDGVHGCDGCCLVIKGSLVDKEIE